MIRIRQLLARKPARSEDTPALLRGAACIRLWHRLRGIPDDCATGKTGRWGEAHAETHLRKSGYRILGRRVRTAHREEIDLIAAHDDTLVFVEVKTRRNETFGRPGETVGRTKRRLLTRAAIRYLTRLRRPPPFARFDVIEVIGRMDRGAPVVRHIQNAFEPEGGWREPWRVNRT